MLALVWGEAQGVRRFDNMLSVLGKDLLPKVAVRALNRTGDMAKTQVIRVLSKQTGLKRKVIVKAIGKPKRASWGDLSYTMTTRGGDISLKYFSPRETRRGVSAKPFNQRRVFAGTFMKGGHFPNRIPLNMGGHVWVRAGSGRLPIEKVKSGVIIPAEMVKGATAEAFERSVQENLPRRVEHEINRASGGLFD